MAALPCKSSKARNPTDPSSGSHVRSYPGKQGAAFVVRNREKNQIAIPHRLFRRIRCGSNTTEEKRVLKIAEPDDIPPPGWLFHEHVNRNRGICAEHRRQSMSQGAVPAYADPQLHGTSQGVNKRRRRRDELPLRDWSSLLQLTKIIRKKLRVSSQQAKEFLHVSRTARQENFNYPQHRSIVIFMLVDVGMGMSSLYMFRAKRGASPIHDQVGGLVGMPFHPNRIGYRAQRATATDLVGNVCHHGSRRRKKRHSSHIGQTVAMLLQIPQIKDIVG